MASSKGRKCNNWRTPEGHLMKCVLTHLWRDGVRNRRELVARFRRLFPKAEAHFSQPLTDAMIVARADHGSRTGYESEWPDRHPETRKYWKVARGIVDHNIACVGIAEQQSS